jgi:hypothetical protein
VELRLCQGVVFGCGLRKSSQADGGHNIPQTVGPPPATRNPPIPNQPETMPRANDKAQPVRAEQDCLPRGLGRELDEGEFGFVFPKEDDRDLAAIVITLSLQSNPRLSLFSRNLRNALLKKGQTDGAER